MIPRKILVATDGSEQAGAALQTALSLAERFASVVGVLTVVDVRQLEGPFISDLSGMVGIAPILNFQVQVRDLLTRKGESVLAAAAEECRRRGVAVKTELSEGVVSRVICDAARAHDLVCLGRRGEHAAWSGLLLGSTVEAVARGSSRPVLVASEPPKELRRLLLAYDGSKTASAALALATDMAGHLGASLTVLTVTANEGEGTHLLDEAREFLQPREVAADFVRSPGDPVPGIVEAAADFDLVVMGAYGHGRLRELFLGSTTTGVLAEVGVPVLLYR